MKKKRTLRDSEVTTIKDAFGTEWHVKEARQTKYGFDLLYGREKNAGPYDISGPDRLIYTSELKAFWEKHSLRHDGTLFDLPAGRTTLKRARRALGFHWDKDSQRFWRRHKSDMNGLKPQAFEEKYKEQKLTGNRMSFWRLRIVGAKARPVDWWRKPQVLNLLLSQEKSLNQVRAELGEKISASQASRLRIRAKRDYEIRDGKLIEIAEHPQD